MVLDVERYSRCLFGYLYKHYKDTPSSELSAGLPISLDYEVPEDFVKVLAECQIVVNRMLRPNFKPVFDKACAWACRNERTFLDFVDRRCQKLPIDHTPLLFLTICAVVSELNLYCFQRDCFRFAAFAPRCLSEVLKNCDEIADAILSEQDPFTVFSRDNFDGFAALQEYCSTILGEVHKNLEYKPPIIAEVGRKFLRMRDRPIDERTEKKSVLSSVAEGDEEPSEEEPLLGAVVPPQTPERCNICKESDCFLYLKRFVDKFRTIYN